MSLIKQLSRSWRSGGFSATSNLFLNRRIKNSKEYWYIGSIKAKSAITKYMTDPLLATILYYSLA